MWLFECRLLMTSERGESFDRQRVRLNPRNVAEVAKCPLGHVPRNECRAIMSMYSASLLEGVGIATLHATSVHTAIMSTSLYHTRCGRASLCGSSRLYSQTLMIVHYLRVYIPS